MTLDEAIKHAEEVAEKNERRAESVRNRPISSADFYHEEESCSKCSEEHRQLAEWLKELKRYKEYGPCAFCKHNTFEESAPCYRCPARMSFAENKIAKVVEE